MKKRKIKNLYFNKLLYVYLHTYLNASENIMDVLAFKVVIVRGRLNFPDNVKLA